MQKSLLASVSLALFLVAATASAAESGNAQPAPARVPSNIHAPTFGCGTGHHGVVTPRVSQTAQLPSTGAAPAHRPSSGSSGAKY